jgi:hypothetical protein
MVALDLGTVTHADFAACLNQSFTMRTDDVCVEAHLISVSPWGGAPHEGRQPFSLIFRGPLTPVLTQQIHVIHSPVLGELEIFLVPVGPDEQGMRYQAVFS